MKKYKNLVLHIPHASAEGLENSGWPKTEAFKAEVNKWTDWKTDDLFEAEILNSPRALKKDVSAVRFPLSRFVLDVERLPDDPLEKIGQGRIYTQFGEYQREVSAGEEAILKRLYELFQEKLVANLTPDSLLVDCHSFPSELSDDIDVCIGYNNDWSQPPQDVIDYIVKRFSEAGFNVAVNTPYSNSITPKCDFHYHSIMIELNKRTYWDEHKMQMTDGAIKLHGMLLSLYVNLLCGFIGDK